MESDFDFVTYPAVRTKPSVEVGRILSGKRITGTDIDHYSKTLSDQDFAYTKMLSVTVGDVGITNFNKNNQKEYTNINTFLAYVKKVCSQTEPSIVFIPIGLKGRKWNPFSENHVTLLIINKVTKSVEYYDSKGTDLSTEKRTLLALKGVTGKDLLEKTTGHLRSLTLDESVDWSKVKRDVYRPTGFWARVLGAIGLSGLGRLLSSHQGAFNRVDCGIFVCQAMKDYLKNSSLENISGSFNIKNARQEIADAIKKASSQIVAPDLSSSATAPLVNNDLRRVSSASVFNLEGGSPAIREGSGPPSPHSS